MATQNYLLPYMYELHGSLSVTFQRGEIKLQRSQIQNVFLNSCYIARSMNSDALGVYAWYKPQTCI